MTDSGFDLAGLLLFTSMCALQNLTGVIVGGLVGIAGGIGTGVVVKLFEHRRQRLNLMSALAGELRAILTVVEERQVLQALEHVIDQIRIQRTPLFFPFWIGEMHSLVFRQNADKLGSLRAPLSEKIVAIHYRIGSVVLELQMLFEASQGRGGWLGEQWRADWRICLRQHEHWVKKRHFNVVAVVLVIGLTRKS